MRPPRFFQRSNRRLIPALLLVLAVLASLTPYAHASTYVGYGSANQGASTCGTNCGGNSNVATDGLGETIQAPFTGTLVSAGFFTGQTLPNQIVILTYAVTPVLTAYSCGSAGTCARVTGNPSATVADVEGLSGLAGSTFFTVNLANPVSVTQNQWVAIMFLAPASNNGYLMFASSGGQTQTGDSLIHFGTVNPAIGASFTLASNAIGPNIVGGTFTIAGTTGTTITATQCYGNCGTPPITLANTNSTHAFNFNQSLTMIYEFQSNLNGFLLNVTTSIAKSYNNGMVPSFGIYQIITCPQGQLPFTAQCPAQLVLSGSPAGSNPGKGKISLVASSGQISVSNGQWIAIAITASMTGLDLNDTNANVALFQTAGAIPPSISQTSTNACACKMGLWAWIVGNIVTGGGATTPSLGCQSFATIDCWIPALVNSFCSTTSQQCQTSSALFWILFLSVIFEVVIAFSFNRISPNLKVPFGEMFIFIVLVLTFLMTGLALLVVWVPVFLFMIGAIMFSKHTGRYF